MKRPDIITFDCYGTLIDWESGIAGAFAGQDARTVLREYASCERELESGRYLSYREVLRETARRVADVLGCTPPDLAASLPSWLPFPDTNAALEAMRAAGVRLAILSNIDEDLIAATQRHFTVDFDFVITAEQVRSYKPALAHFHAARERIGDARWLHAAASNFHDVVPTNSLRIENAWINRNGHPALPGGTPAHEFRDLTGLAEAVAN
jgi:2-haloalkanoic acid dehalogenase type II